MKNFKKYFSRAAEIILFIFALAVFCYSGYKIVSHYGFLNGKVLGMEWGCHHPCPCRPTPTSPPSEPTPTSVPESTPTPTSPPPGGVGGTSEGGGGGGGGGPASPCTPPEAPKTPVLLSAVAISSTEVKLMWTKVDRASHYVIAYGLSSRNYIYGNANVGNVDSYIVGALQSGKIYYFVVSAAIGGDCPVASPYSNEVANRTFPVGVLGAKTDPPVGTPTPDGDISGGVSTSAGEIAGTQNERACPYWWYVLLGQTLVLGVFYALNLRRREWLKRWPLVTVAAVLLAYFIDRYAHTHWYVPSRLCPWEKWLGILLAGAETTLFRKIKKTS